MISSQNNRHRGDYLWASFYLQGSDGSFPNIDPASGELLGEIPYRADAVDIATADAQRAFEAWGNTQLDQRIAVIRRARDLLQSRREAIAEIIASEMGKALWEARLECAAGVRAIDLFIDAARPLLLEQPHPSVRGIMRRRPLGPIGVVTPYPYPIFGPIQQLIPALIAGNTIVWKPSSLVPISAQKLVEVFDSARLPPGVISLVQGPRDPVGTRLLQQDSFKLLLAAGSASTGEQIRMGCSGTRSPWVQTGGKGWAIVCADADLDRAAYEVVTSAFLTTGQRCNSTSRVLIEGRVAQPFLKRVIALSQTLRIGNPSSEGVFCGPLVDVARRQAFDAHLRSLAQAGVEFPLEGGSGQLRGELRQPNQAYVAPAVALVEGSPPADSILPEEVQGPLLVASLVNEPETAAALYNEHPYGMSAAVFTGSEARFRYLASILRAGTLNWNRGTTVASARYPNAGLRRSGYGAETNVSLLRVCSWPQSSLSAQGEFNPTYRVPGMGWPREMDAQPLAPEGVASGPVAAEDVSLEDEVTLVPNKDLA